MKNKEVLEMNYREEYKVFEQDHPELKRLSDAGYKELLEWADEKRYITLKGFRTEKYYTEEDFETALMWAEKEEMNFPSRPYILKVMYADECREITVCRCETEEEAFNRARDFKKETEDRVYFRIDKDE